VLVGYEVAKALHAPLDVFIVRKLGLPGQEELAMGAIATGGVRVLNRPIVEALGITKSQIDSVAAAEQQVLERRELRYRGGRAAPGIQGRTVILVDDGIATGSTMRAAIAALRKQKPARLIVAVPVAPLSTVRELRAEGEEIVWVQAMEPFGAIGAWYEDFTQVADEEVSALLESAAEKRSVIHV
jgi:putative phosphoribosyl transferase